MTTQSICLALVLVLLCPFASAQWVQTNVPNGNRVSCFAVSGANLFAGGAGGLSLSTNSGTSWTAVNTRVDSSTAIGYVNALAVSDTNLFAGTLVGAFRSSNNGVSWTQAGFFGSTVTALVVKDTLLFAGVSVYSGMVTVFVSSDNGASWTDTGLNLEDSGQGGAVTCFAVSGTFLFAGAIGHYSDVGYAGGGVFLSTNNGTSWTEADSGLSPLEFNGITCAAVNGSGLFVATERGVYVSTNNGTSWAPANSGLPLHNEISALVASGTNLFAGTHGGGDVFSSTNSGTSWTAVNTGLTDTVITALAIAGTNLFAGTADGGIWRRPASQVASVNHTDGLPSVIHLEQNYPNPFNPSTTIKYELPKSSQVTLSVFDILGREGSVLVSERMDEGVHEAKLDGSTLSSGVYFYRLQAGDFVQSKRMIIVK